MVSVLKKVGWGLGLCFIGFQGWAQEELAPHLDTLYKPVNICNCFEAEERALNDLMGIVNLAFEEDSSAVLDVYWTFSMIEPNKVQFDSGLLGLGDMEHEAMMISEELFQDSLYHVSYIVPSLEYSPNLRPEVLMFGDFRFQFNRMQPIDRDKLCGEYVVPIK